MAYTSDDVGILCDKYLEPGVDRVSTHYFAGKNYLYYASILVCRMHTCFAILKLLHNSRWSDTIEILYSQKLSILPRSGGALGFTYTPPTNEDRYLLFIDELRGRLVTLLGGRAAEEVVYSGRVSTGALDDIRRATDMAYKAVAEYGLNETIGPVSLATLSGGGIDDSGGSTPWGRDQVFLIFFYLWENFFFLPFSG